ncbi:hypothetical protein ASPZODRAFT_149097 [Penicilliopsis zonata CBS 506.65]|uniref:Uncharacterized protein n=1 Tax=Penicilliopsis zonata CBS 506.65 TaxID=1073090 RepID=A0A1L9SR52_9EURO|nr:hypothetical protein ASPZODRAFT_149097 [Penicilliopsis zonata CBS 506.65]OJJ49577.1 hypothetical protein ASPZODRAFT_149097 [Penicilliopsis zonata CBS 506.65]
MNRYRNNAPGVRGPTRATASTLCQKCLKRDTYECKAAPQERPYASRPSRTQQLRNPKLAPKLSTEVPNDLLRTKGVADELLAKRETEHTRSAVHDGRSRSRRRSRSNSSVSVSSVSTISTSREHSASPDRQREHDSKKDDERALSRTRKRRYSDSPSEYSDASYSSANQPRSRSREWPRDKNTRRRRRESSPVERGRPRDSFGEGNRRDRTRSRSSLDKSRAAKERRSLTPEAPYQRSEASSHGMRAGPGQSHLPPQPRRERSLSPYSKRLALTQAMNIGR